MGHRIYIDRDKLHPWLNYKLDLLLKNLEKKQMFIIITGGYRSSGEQAELYAKGRTQEGSVVTNARPGYSQHNWGIAVDIAMNYDVDGDKEITDDTWNKKGFRVVAKEAKKVGLGWGGDWKPFKDMPHLYLKEWGSTPTKLRKTYGNYETFQRSWYCKVKKKTNIRKGRSFLSKTLKVVPAGTRMKRLWKSKYGYTKVDYSGNIGYIRNKNVK